ncbi:hypothetical protein cypCar_00005796 [Cyprinus carpio]|nr:hypothetical protein cypCar_00005796 [Cyprinus carpio]
MDANTNSGSSARAERKQQEKAKIIQREKQRQTVKTISRLLQKAEGERTQEDRALLQEHQDTVQELSRRQSRRSLLKRKQEEVFDDAENLKAKVKQLAEELQQAKHVVLYTGAGISTAASIPDYRGPNGVWTQLQKGRSVSASDLSRAEPTLTHMCIWMLHKVKMVCDSCSPAREFIRLFDVTERTALHRHGTGRLCPHCRVELRDTIVHFGFVCFMESLCIEASKRLLTTSHVYKLMKLIRDQVLKKYSCLWCMNRPANKRPKLYIVNLQWTPKDNLATLKIHGKCDAVMGLLMEELGLEIPVYNRQDPLNTEFMCLIYC